MFAAIDLGSVSFHLVIMGRKKQRLVWIDCKKEIVRLAAGLDTSGNLKASTRKKALRCLRYFRSVIRHIPEQNICAVGTSSFRRLAADETFLAEAQAALGRNIQILSGEQEAEYIYRGVSSTLPEDKRFVIDIGGGSTELIIGSGREARQVCSLEMGCISISDHFFRGGCYTPEQFLSAERYAREQIKQKSALFREHNWESEYGTSGSLKAISWALQKKGITDGEITREALAELKEGLLQCRSVQQVARLAGLSPRRSSYFAGGFIILSQIFEEAGLSFIKISQGAIREGIIDELTAKARPVMATRQTYSASSLKS